MRSQQEVNDSILFLRDLKFFKNGRTKETELHYILSAFTYEQHKRETQLITYNEIGEKFYLILKG